jgi:drug/metabolite transporter (DMT)-like permease
VFVAIGHGLPAGLAALIVSLQPLLTSTIAQRFLGERVGARQWAGLALGFVGVYLVLRDKTVAGEATPLAWAAVTARGQPVLSDATGDGADGVRAVR